MKSTAARALGKPPSGTRRAQLADLGYRGLGSVFWVVTEDYAADGSVVGSGTGPAGQVDPMTAVAYRGDTPTWFMSEENRPPDPTTEDDES